MNNLTNLIISKLEKSIELDNVVNIFIDFNSHNIYRDCIKVEELLFHSDTNSIEIKSENKTITLQNILLGEYDYNEELYHIKQNELDYYFEL